MSTMLTFIMAGFSGLLFPKVSSLPKEATERKYEIHATAIDAWKRDFEKIGGDARNVLAKKSEAVSNAKS